MRVLGVGHTTLDTIGVVERFAEGDTSREFDQFSTQGGGSAATAVVALARWGVETAFIGKVGDDARGLEIARTLAEEGVDTAGLVHQPDAVSQMSVVLIESSTGRRASYLTRGTVIPLVSDEVTESALDGVSALLCDCTHLDVELQLMRAARARGITVVLDASVSSAQVREAVSLADTLVMAERFASQFAGVGDLENLCTALLDHGPKTVIVTLGNEGSVAMSATDRVLVREAAHGVTALDTTGVGDVFHGAVTYGVLQGWDLSKLLRFANVSAALSCEGIGGRSRIPAVQEVLDLT